ncbi:MAG TPA: DUF6807 family protein [Planctomycetota bacterium]|jgi:hypothetical protein
MNCASFIAALLLLVCVCAFGAEGLQIASNDPAVTVKDGDKLVLEYLISGVTHKPYVRQFLSPSGVNVMRDQVADHIHHHGLMYAIKVDGVNFWEETKGCGKENHKAVSGVGTSVTGGVSAATFTEQLDWTAEDGKTLLNETRNIIVYKAADIPASLLTWRATLAAPEGKPEIKLGGNHYHGLGMRFLKAMDTGGEFFTPEGKVKGEVVRGDEQLTKSTWIAYGAEVEGKPVTVALFDHPSNPRKAQWFSMTNPFAYMSATMNLHREPLPVVAGKPAAIVYGVAIWDGRVKAEDVEKVCKRWLEIAK